MESNKIKRLRVSVDKFINTVEHLEPSREVSLVNTELQRSKMWMGQGLKTLGETDYPYPESADPTSEKIEDQADHTEEVISFDDIPDNQVARVKHLRALLDRPIKIGFELKNYGEINHHSFDKFDQHSYSYALKYMEKAIFSLIEARMWLGMELHRIHIMGEPKVKTHTDKKQNTSDDEVGKQAGSKSKSKK